MVALPTHFNFASDVMLRWVRERPEAPALWVVNDAGDEQKLTFAELADQFQRAANHFQKTGIRPGEPVLLMMPRVPAWWAALLGLIRLGAIPIPCTTLLTKKDIEFRMETSGARVIVTEELWREASPEVSCAPTRSEDPGIIYFTSATTGPPKMVLHTQASYGLGHEMTGKLWLDLKPDDVHWCITDTGWAKAAWSCVFGPWHAGACVFAVDSRGKFDPKAALQVLADFPITTWCAPPTALRLIVREEIPALRKLRHCTSAGEPLNPEVIETWKRATGLTIHEGYGQTESVCMIATLPGMEVRPGSMGKPMPGFEIGLLDHDLRESDEGEIAVRVKPARPLGLFQEYWRNPDENARRFRGDWYLTGDTARRDRDGYYWFIGRADDVIKSSAYRIGPFEVESALVEHPAVLEAAVVGKPDEIRGQIVKAFVVLRKGFTVTEAELIEHCKKVTAPYKHPREIEFLSELPKTISGKIRRVELRQR